MSVRCLNLHYRLFFINALVRYNSQTKEKRSVVKPVLLCWAGRDVLKEPPSHSVYACTYSLLCVYAVQDRLYLQAVSVVTVQLQ